MTYDPNNVALSEFCLVAFVIAQGSDQLDGWIARNYSQPNIKGYLQDSIADKLLHFGCLLGFVPYFPWIGIIVWTLFARETITLAIRVVVNDLNAVLKKYKYQSIIYAATIRVGIFVIISSPVFSEWKSSLLLFGYTLLASASVLGVLNITVVVRGTAKDESRQR